MFKNNIIFIIFIGQLKVNFRLCDYKKGLLLKYTYYKYKQKI